MERLLTKIGVLLIALILLTGAILAQKPAAQSAWEQKPISEWDDSDVKAILKNSAWGKLIIGKPSASSPLIGTVVYESNLVFTLRSALIVRYALVRSEQLKGHYDSLDEKAKAEFNKKLRPVIECPMCERSYIVAVSGFSDLLRQAPRIKNRAPGIFLSNERGEKRELSNYSPPAAPGSEALFIFNRYDSSGKPLLTPDNVTLTFNFKSEPNDEPVIKLLERIEIKVRDIVRENQVIF